MSTPIGRSAGSCSTSRLPRTGSGCSTSWRRRTSWSRTPWRAPGSGSAWPRTRLRTVNPALVYARAKGFGVAGPLASRPCFDYVVQAATGMEMTQGGGVRPVPVNFTANDYGTGLLLGAGIVLALLGRARGVAVTGVDASLALTATVFQSEDVAALATAGFCSRSGRGGPARCVDVASPVSRQGRVGDGVLRDGRPPEGVAAGVGPVATALTATAPRRRSLKKSATPSGC